MLQSLIALLHKLVSMVTDRFNVMCQCHLRTGRRHVCVGTQAVCTVHAAQQEDDCVSTEEVSNLDLNGISVSHCGSCLQHTPLH